MVVESYGFHVRLSPSVCWNSAGMSFRFIYIIILCIQPPGDGKRRNITKPSACLIRQLYIRRIRFRERNWRRRPNARARHMYMYNMYNSKCCRFNRIWCGGALRARVRNIICETEFITLLRLVFQIIGR